MNIIVYFQWVFIFQIPDLKQWIRHHFCLQETSVHYYRQISEEIITIWEEPVLSFEV